MIRPSRTPTSALTMPQWSSTTAPVMTRSGVPSARVATACPIDSRITLPPPNTASSPPGRTGSSLDLDEQVGVGQPDPVARRSARTASAYRGRGSIDSASPPHRLGRPSWPGAARPRSPGTTARPPSGTSDTSRSTPGLEPHRGARRDVQAAAPGGVPVEPQRRVGRGEVEVRADLDRPVAGVRDHSVTTARSRPALSGTGPSPGRISPGITGSARCTVTSFVPSGNVASTCTSSASRALPP